MKHRFWNRLSGQDGNDTVPSPPPMKLPSSIKRPSRGMSLLELTVVILVMLSLISILFIGARAWMQGSDRSGCILNIRNGQNAVRAYQNVRGLPEGMPINMAAEILGPGRYLEFNPRCPSSGTYTMINHIPYSGELALTCSLSASNSHEPPTYSDW